jgi:hypothetical protein
MERNILDLRPNCNLVMDVDMIWAVDIYCEPDIFADKQKWSVRVFSQGVSTGYRLECDNKESAEALFKVISDKMKQ